MGLIALERHSVVVQSAMEAGLRTWANRTAAEQLRQWPTVVDLAERVAATAALEGLLLIGSFAAGRADDLSDLDTIAVVAEGRFAEAWRERGKLHPAGVLVEWDHHAPPGMSEEVAAHKWLTDDLVLVERLLTTPAGGARLAKPFVVLVGEQELADRLPRREPIPRADLEEFARQEAERGATHEVQTRYDKLARAVRARRGT